MLSCHPQSIHGKMRRGRLSAIVCALLVLCISTPSTQNPATGIRTALIHRDHRFSPLHDSRLSLKPQDRLAETVRRSIARIHHLERLRHMITVESPVSFAREGAYVMNISLGTPPQSFLLVADTGSDVTWVQCRPCEQCFTATDSIFDPTKSSTYRRLPCSNSHCAELRRQEFGSCGGGSDDDAGCQYHLQYGDGSFTHGNFSTDSLTVGTTQRERMVSDAAFAFGCGHNKEGVFEGIDGVVGLGRGSLSFPSQISKFSIAQKFSYCLVNFWKASTERSRLFFGSLAAANSVGMKFTALVRNELRSSNYYVDMEGIAVDGVPLGISPSAFLIRSDGLGGTFLDSGTTVTHLVRPAYEALLRILNSTIDYQIGYASHLRLELCFDFSTSQFKAKFPSISFQFRGADLDLPPENVFISVDRKGTRCLAMLPSVNFNVIGSLQMQNFQFLYDVENSRIGFKREDCGGEPL